MKLILFSTVLFLLASCEENAPISVTPEEEVIVEDVEKEITDGEYTDYHANGKIKTIGVLKNGLRNGKWESYFSNGLIQSENKYTNGTLSGKTAVYYPNGNVQYVGLYINDKKDGTWYFYLENGTFSQEITYKAGVDVTPEN